MKKQYNGYRAGKHGGDLETARERFNLDPDCIIDFSANINPLGPPPAVMRSLKENLHFIARYPDPLYRGLKKAIAEHFNLFPDGVIAGNGASELLYLFCHSVRPRTALIPVPAFTEYEAAVRAAGGTAVLYPLEKASNFKLTADELWPYLQKVDAVFLGNPNNPTGQLIPPDELEKIISCSEKAGNWLILDEAFLDFIEPQVAGTALTYRPFPPRLFVLRSLTKFYALPGLRLGFGYGSPALVHFLDQRRDPWSINILAQLAGETALKEKEFAQRTRRYISREREFMWQGLQKIKGLAPLSGEANFILVEILAPGFTAGQLVEALAARGILIRDCRNFWGLGDNYFRVAVRSRLENTVLLKNLAEIVVEQ